MARPTPRRDPTQPPPPFPSDVDPSAKPSASSLGGETAPADLSDELASVDVGGGPGGPAPAGELAGPPVEDLRAKVRSLWYGVAMLLQARYGAALQHTPQDIETLTEGTLPMAEAFGLEWLGKWAHIIGFLGAVAAVELPKFQALQAARPREVRPAAAPAPTPPAGPVTETSAGAPRRGPAATEVTA